MIKLNRFVMFDVVAIQSFVITSRKPKHAIDIRNIRVIRFVYVLQIDVIHRTIFGTTNRRVFSLVYFSYVLLSRCACCSLIREKKMNEKEVSERQKGLIDCGGGFFVFSSICSRPLDDLKNLG